MRVGWRLLLVPVVLADLFLVEPSDEQGGDPPLQFHPVKLPLSDRRPPPSRPYITDLTLPAFLADQRPPLPPHHHPPHTPPTTTTLPPRLLAGSVKSPGGETEGGMSAGTLTAVILGSIVGLVVLITLFANVALPRIVGPKPRIRPDTRSHPDVESIRRHQNFRLAGEGDVSAPSLSSAGSTSVPDTMNP